MRPFCRSREPLRATLAALILLALSLTLAGFVTENSYLRRIGTRPQTDRGMPQAKDRER